jgi:membrane protein YdbS with pleckstrin-like domain
MTADGAAPFDVADVQWSPVSGRLAPLRRTVLLVLVGGLVVVAAVVLALLVGRGAAVGVALAGAAALGWGWVAIGRGVRAWGYTERADDLLIRSGVLVRRLVVVPYGRMQFVDVTSGPLERRFGLATVRLHTAAATTDAYVPGLVPEEAARLRDHLSARGEVQAAGL